MNRLSLRRVSSVARKEFLHLLRDPATMFFAIVIPLIELMLLGYDAVAYFTDNAAVKGDPAIKLEHLGVTYRFASEAHKAEFAKSPEKYMPQFVGLGYEGIMIIRDAILKAGIKNRPDTLAEDRRKVRDQLALVKDYKSFAGMTLNMNANRDIERPTYLVKITGGEFKLYWTPEKGFLF